MKVTFLVIAIFINFFNHSLIKSEEKIFTPKNNIEILLEKNQLLKKKLK